ncbi:MAG: lipopolysaccharide heptosyltransferase II [Gammaproteobacteria bacterium]
MAGDAQHILVVGPAWVGDMVMTQSLLLTLKQQYPQAVIDVLAPEWSLPILQRMPQVRRGICLPLRHKQLGLWTRWRIGRQLCRANYAQAIILPRSFKAALLPFFARIPIRTGYRGESRYGVINDMRALDKTTLTQTVQRYVALALAKTAPLPPAIPFPRLTVDRQNQQRLLRALQLTTDKPIIGLVPGAEYGPAKQWPMEHYRDLAVQLTAQGYRVWVFGSAKEQELGRAIAVNGDIVNLSGRTQLVDVIDLLACCQSVVSNDSGLMHIAAAVDTRVVVIYGSSTPDYTPPLTRKANIIYHRLACSPCFSRQCRYGHYDCLTSITCSEVMEHLC